jgi:hypothetical protein
MSKENYDVISHNLTMADNWDKIKVIYRDLYEEPLELTAEEYWDLFLDGWVTGEHNSTGEHLEIWVEIINDAEHPVPDKHKEGLPEGEFKIYRGGDSWGLSWTLSKEKAVWFQERKLHENMIHNPNPQKELGPLSEKTITKDDAVFYNNEREEQEVVILTDETFDYMKTDEFKKDTEELNQQIGETQAYLNWVKELAKNPDNIKEWPPDKS